MLAHAEGLCPSCVIRSVVDLEDIDRSELSATLRNIRYVGNYELLDEIARGGMGVVYRARQTTLNRDVAVKLVSNGAFASPEMLRRFRAEAELAARLDHPRIVPIYEVGEHDGLPYFSMALVQGETLADVIGGKPMPPTRCAELVIGIARAVQFAHDRGILHRDLKPTNVLIDRAGQPHLTDFGLAKLMDGDNSLTRSSAVLGTPGYMAPEQARGETHATTTATDIYSIGAILYHCLTGRPPFVGETVIQVIQQVISLDPHRPSEFAPYLDRDLEVICLKCLEKDAARRYSSASALADDLERWQRGEPITARPTGSLETFLKLLRRHPLPSTLAAVAVLALVVGATGVAMQWHRAEQALRTAEERLYAADIHLAQQAIKEQDRARALKLLDAHLPEAGARDLRGAEWRYLWRAAQGNEDFILTNRSAGGTLFKRFSNDSKWLALANRNTFEVWDVDRRALRWIFTRSDEAASVSFDSAGRRLLACDRKTLSVFDLQTGATNWSLAVTNGFRAEFIRDDAAIVFTAGTAIASGTLGSAEILSATDGHLLQSLPSSAARALAVSPGGATFALGMRGNVNQLWDSQTGLMIREFTNAMQITALAFTPDGRKLVAACWDGYLQEWDTATGEFLREKKVHRTHIWSVAIAPDGTIFTGSGDHTSRAWDPISWAEKRDFSGHRGPIFGVAYDPGRGLFTASASGQMRFWYVDAARGATPGFRSVPYRWAPMAMIAGDNLVLQNENGPRLVERATGRELRAFGEPGIASDFLADKQHVIIVMPTNRVTTIWNIVTDAKREVHLEKYVPGRNLPLREWAPGQIMEVNTKAMFWDGASGKLVREFKAFEGRSYGSRISPDRKYLVVGGNLHDRGLANVIRIADAQTVTNFTMSSTVEEIAFSADGARMAACSWDHSVKVFSFPDLQLLAELKGQLGAVYNICFTSDGQLFSGSEDGTTLLWDLRTGLEMMRFPYQYCQTLEDGAWVFGGEPNPRNGDLELVISKPPSFADIAAQTIR